MDGEPAERAGPKIRERLRRDPQFQAELKYCVGVGIPYSIFSGRVQKDGDPLWLESDREKVTAWLLEDGEMCPCGCGQKAEDSMARKNQNAYDAEMIRCHARAAIKRRELKDLDSGDNADMNNAGMLVRLSRFPLRD